MVRILFRSLLLGLAGFIAVPIITFLIVLALFYLVNDRCGTTGDSGGCEMTAGLAAAAVAIPGFVIAFAMALTRSLRRRKQSAAIPADINNG